MQKINRKRNVNNQPYVVDSIALHYKNDTKNSKLQVFIFFSKLFTNYLLLSLTKEEGHLVIQYTNQL